MGVRRIYPGKGRTVIVTQKRPKAKAAALGMARAGHHDIRIRHELRIHPGAFRRLKAAALAGIWSRGEWW